MNKIKEIMNFILLKPSNFKEFPWNSITQSLQDEVTAVNIMKVLAKTGDTWRNLSWEEYQSKSDKDVIALTDSTEFKRISHYCKSPDTAVLFSPSWAEKANKQREKESIKKLASEMVKVFPDYMEKVYAVPADIVKKLFVDENTEHIENIKKTENK